MAKARVRGHDALCPKRGSNMIKKDGRSRGKRQRKCNQCGKKRQKGAKHRFADERKAQAVKMRAEGMSMSAFSRLLDRLPGADRYEPDGCASGCRAAGM